MSFVDLSENQNEKIEGDPFTRPHINTEANLAVIPWVVARTKKGNQNEILFKYSEVKEGTVVHKKVLVSMASKEKDGKPIRETLPTQFDHDVFSCVVDLWHEQGRSRDGRVEFRTVDVCRHLLIDHKSGENRRSVNASLNRLSRLTIESSNAFYSATMKKRVNKTFGLFSLQSESEGAIRTSPNRTHTVFLDQIILENLSHNYSLQLNRISYQKLKNFYSKRIFNLVAHQEQIEGHRERFDFDVFYLAEFLPISGARHVAKIKERLAISLKELTEKGIFTYEYVSQPKSEILRLYSEFKSPDFLDDADAKKFVGVIYECYKVQIEEVLKLNEEDISNLVRKDKRTPHVIDGIKYSQTFFNLHVLIYQIVNKTIVVKRDVTSLVSSMIKKDSSEIVLPIGFRHLHKLREELRIRLREQKEIIPEKTISLHYRDRETVILKTAQTIEPKLTANQRQKYIKELRSDASIHSKMLSSWTDDSERVKGAIVLLIERDLAKGIDIDFEGNSDQSSSVVRAKAKKCPTPQKQTTPRDNVIHTEPKYSEDAKVHLALERYNEEINQFEQLLCDDPENQKLLQILTTLKSTRDLLLNIK
jgi:hypothetical protein